MRALRNFFSWIFALTAVLCAPLILPILRRIFRHSSADILSDLILILVYSVFLTVFGAAWWTVWRGKRSARFWGIAASFINTSGAVLIIVLSRSVNAAFIGLAVGVGGLVVFSRPYENPCSAPAPRQNVRIPGDGTSNLFDKLVHVVIFAVGYGVYSWWLQWLRANDIPAHIAGWQHLAMMLVVLLVITILHELGHTLIGIALGMKLWAFVAGPFEWRICDGKWEFHFKPLAILIGGGATSVVPATTNFSLWRHLFMLSGGVLINLLTGISALWIAFTAGNDSPFQVSGFTALFGAWSLLLGTANLLPFRTLSGLYSDGAHAYQVLAGGPMADLQRVHFVISSSLVTSLRPRDYDIDAINRCADGIGRLGREALLLRLFTHSYYLDLGRLPEAGKALRDAESIYDESAPDIPAELCTVFIFGNAYVLHDAAGARQWWTRMTDKKPARFNADYWRADSALHWIEGDWKKADESLAKSEASARKLPAAGAYEFDRLCCFLLREALDESSATRLTPALADGPVQ